MKDSNVWCIVQYIPSGFAVIQVAVVVKFFFIFCNMSATSLGDRTVVHMCIYTTTVIAAVTKPKRQRKPYSCAQPEGWLRGGTPAATSSDVSPSGEESNNDDSNGDCDDENDEDTFWDEGFSASFLLKPTVMHPALT